MSTFEEMFPAEVESSVVATEPAITDSPTAGKPATTPEVPKVEDTTSTEKTNTENKNESSVAETNTVGTPAPIAEQPIVSLDTERLKQLHEATVYKPLETSLEILDEFGNLDQTKFETFMRENNKNVFSQAISAVNANNEAIEIENKAWDAVHKQYPEMNETLEKAVRGARVQDLINGGKGDLMELAKGIVGPIRDNKIKAIEDTNRVEREKSALSTIKPSNETPSAQAPSLIQQLKTAISNGNREGAQAIRHAILKEQIYGKNSNES